MTLPPALRRRLEQRFGPVREGPAVGGGCVNRALRVDLASGPAFLKYHERSPAGAFPAEARALAALRAAAGEEVRVPEVLAAFDPAGEGAPGEPGWLLLEWIEPGAPGPGYDERLGRGLAALHRAASGPWGWDGDGFIATLPQPNAPAAGWAAFWRDRRLEPMLRRARDAGHAPGAPADWERLLARLPGLLAPADADGPSLLHGDLWSGNVRPGADGAPWLVDPAAYRGHREVDLAMTALFGGFSARFRAAYAGARPLLRGWQGREPVYRLYPLLVHVVLFGGGYAAQTGDALREALRAS